jgi:anti-sigma regulatory factor (Ser/Thr protein kinase)
MTGDVLSAANALHGIISKRGYSDVILDFTEAGFLNPAFMVPIVTLARAYRLEQVNFEIEFPADVRSANLLKNANWAHLISPEHYDERSQYNKLHFSAVQYKNAEEHFRVVDQSLSFALQSAKGLDRSRLKALEWALNEITDNVLNHAESPIGGILQMVTFPTRQAIEFYVCDAGLGIPRTLRRGRPDLLDDVRALRAAVEEGVTRDRSTNQGNGLFGTFKCCEVSGGEFEILTGNISLRHRPGQMNVSRSPIPFKGTFVRARINYSFEKLLERALIFKGKPHDPGFDYVERMYETAGEDLNFRVSKELDAFGSREAGRLARTKIENLMDNGTKAISFDFEDIHLISSSFADEVFGKLFADLSPLRFGQLCKFRNVDSTVQKLIDRAIEQRMKA